MLDINLLRDENSAVKVRQSQRKRFASVELVDEVIHLDKEWRRAQFELDNLRKVMNNISREVGILRISGADASGKIKSTKECKNSIAAKDAEVQKAKNLLLSKLALIGNIVDNSVPIGIDEAYNLVVRMWGEIRTGPRLKNHVELVELLGIADLERGANVAGGRGFFLKGVGVLVNQALVNFGFAFLGKRKYPALQTPFFMKQDMMEKCAQLAQFDEELYKVTGAGDDIYLIATAEQPLCAYFSGKGIHPSELPIRHAGYSTCFRKEAGSHGRDTLGIFRTHQFEKVEQFSMTSPYGTDSWEMHEEMIKRRIL